MHDESDEEEFIYPGSEANASPAAQAPDLEEDSVTAFEYESSTAFEQESSAAFDCESQTTFQYELHGEHEQAPEQELQEVLVSPTPCAVSPPTDLPGPFVEAKAPSPVPSEHRPSPAQLEALHAAAASGDLRRVQTEFRSAVRADDVEPFELANDASPRTGLTALHAAASRGWLDVVRWRACFPASSYVFRRVLRPLFSFCLCSGAKSWRNVERSQTLRTKRAR